MKKIQLIIVILGCILLVGCIDNTTSINASNSDTEDSTSFNKDCFCPCLLSEINDFVANDSLTDIYSVWFAKKGGNRCLVISTACFYHKEALVGYSLIDDKLIVYYGVDGDCSAIQSGVIDSHINSKANDAVPVESLIDTSKLFRGYPSSFPDEDSDIAQNSNYDPFGRIYFIHSRDSIDLIYQGGL